jgi:hypothetical protein
LFVEQRDGRPIGPAAAGTFGVYGLNGGFKLKSSDAALLESLGQMA